MTEHQPASEEDVDLASSRGLIDWYSPGESRSVQVGDVRVIVRFVGRKGRRARIAILSEHQLLDESRPTADPQTNHVR